MPKPKHEAGWLQDDLFDITSKIVTGEIELAEGRKATPHVLAKIVGELRKEDAPSTGAVAACLHRWVKLGFITTYPKPLAFKDFTAAGRKHGLGGLQAKAAEARKAERAAAKEASKPAKPESTEASKPAKPATKKATKPAKPAAKKATKKADAA